MKELDELLLRYLERRYEQASDADKEAFQGLLALPDPELVSYLLNKQTPAAELQRVVEQILQQSDS
jgi:succinate dehydrogenase flavin-adding protein (antitoxin of CptAB toxin-antitoxin module)